MTWGGKTYATPIVDIISEFSNRIPISSATNHYLMENSLWKTAQATGTRLYIISAGNFYGEAGHDLQSMMMSIWRENEILLPNLGQSNNKVPMIHVSDFAALVMNSINDVDSSAPCFIPACDCNVLPTRDTIGSFYQAMNSSSPSFKYLSDDDVMDEMVNSTSTFPEFCRWSLDISFSVIPFECCLAYREGLLKARDALWKDFLFFNNLNPCSIVMAGGPQSGKTTISKQLSSM